MKSSIVMSGQNAGAVDSQVLVLKQKRRKIVINGAVLLSLVLYAVDNIYRLVNNINYSNKESCLFFKNAPKAVFLVYENFIELWLVMIFGIFCAVILSRYFAKYGRFYPKGPFSAFLYGSLMPVCSCSAIPLLTTMKGKLRFRTIITFTLAAPLLSPIIIFISFSVLGTKYAVLRILCSFILAISAGYFLELFYKPEDKISIGAAIKCNKNCKATGESILDETWEIAKKLLPYILIAGALATVFSIFEGSMVKYVHHTVNTWYGKIITVAIGVPLYVCNGADVFILQSFMNGNVGMPMGSAISFSLTSSALCVSSIVMLSKVLGKKLTSILVGYISVLCLAMGFII